MLEHAMRIPSLLRAVDSAFLSRARPEISLPLIQNICGVEMDLLRWFEQSSLPRVSFKEGPSTLEKSLPASLQPTLAHLEQVFGHNDGFSSFHVANAYVLFRVVQLGSQPTRAHASGASGKPRSPRRVRSGREISLQDGAFSSPTRRREPLACDFDPTSATSRSTGFSEHRLGVGARVRSTGRG